VNTGPAKTPRLRAVVREGDGWIAARLLGIIDEHSALPRLLEGRAPSRLLLDLSGVRRINSMGVRDWVHWVEELRHGRTAVVLFDVPPSLMEQVNLIRNFAGGALIHSVLAPYYCAQCDVEATERVETATLLRTSPPAPPSVRCPQGGCSMELDEVEETFFAFLQDQPDPSEHEAVGAQVRAARAALSAAEQEGIPLVSERPDTPNSTIARLRGASGAAGTRGRRSDVSRAVSSPATRLERGSRGPSRGDVVFYAILTLMVGALGVVLYLLLALE